MGLSFLFRPDIWEQMSPSTVDTVGQLPGNLDGIEVTVTHVLLTWLWSRHAEGMVSPPMSIAGRGSKCGPTTFRLGGDWVLFVSVDARG